MKQVLGSASQDRGPVTLLSPVHGLGSFWARWQAIVPFMFIKNIQPPYFVIIVKQISQAHLYIMQIILKISPTAELDQVRIFSLFNNSRPTVIPYHPLLVIVCLL